MPEEVFDPAVALREGVLACREERWKEGLELLGRLHQEGEGKFKLPPAVYSYLGLAKGRVQRKYEEAVQLCRHAIELDPVDPESYLNLAQVYMLTTKRRAALRCLHMGLSMNPGHRRLLAMQDELGKRKGPVLPGLGREHFLNRLLGRVRHKVKGGNKKKPGA